MSFALKVKMRSGSNSVSKGRIIMSSVHPSGQMRESPGRRRGARWMGWVMAAACALPLAGCGDNSPPDFTLALASGQTAKASIVQGGTTQIKFQVAAVHDSTGSITLVLSGLPQGVGVAPGSATVGIGSPQTFVLSAAATAPVTSAPVTLTASGVSGNPLSSNSITHTQTVTLAVTAATP